MNQDYLDTKLQNLLRTIPQKDGSHVQVGMSDVPDPNTVVPYIILYQSPSPRPVGTMGDPEDCVFYDYLVKSVGRNHVETTRVASQARDRLTSHTGNGFAYPLSVTGMTIVHRETVSLGIVVKSNGPSLFERNDIYRITVTPSDG